MAEATFDLQFDIVMVKNSFHANKKISFRVHFTAVFPYNTKVK